MIFQIEKGDSIIDLLDFFNEEIQGFEYSIIFKDCRTDTPQRYEAKPTNEGWNVRNHTHKESENFESLQDFAKTLF